MLSKLEYTALHEACHAVIRFALGVPVERIVVNGPRDGYVDAAWTIDHLLDRQNGADLEKEICTLYAGGMAAERCGLGKMETEYFQLGVEEDPVGVGVQGDVNIILDLAGQKWSRSPQRRAAQLQRLLNRTRRILMEPVHWKAAQGIAEALLAQEGLPKVLDGVTARGIFDRARSG